MQPGRNFKGVPRQFPPESELGPDSPTLSGEDIWSSSGEISWILPEVQKQYHGYGFTHLGNSGQEDYRDTVAECGDKCDADYYNQFHQPSTSGRRGGAD